jgi:hypothetical protein
LDVYQFFVFKANGLNLRLGWIPTFRTFPTNKLRDLPVLRANIEVAEDKLCRKWLSPVQLSSLLS